MIAQPPIARKDWTYTEVAAFEDDARFEIHDGELFQMPSPTWNHQHIAGFLYRLLMNWADVQDDCAFMGPVDLYYSRQKYFIPDLLFYSAQSLQNPEVFADRKRFRVAPDLIIEVASPSTEKNDRTTKVRAYAEFGVPHYWIIDPESQTLQALELRDGVYFIAAALGDGETFAPLAFPGFELDLKALFDFIA